MTAGRNGVTFIESLARGRKEIKMIKWTHPCFEVEKVKPCLDCIAACTCAHVQGGGKWGTCPDGGLSPLLDAYSRPIEGRQSGEEKVDCDRLQVTLVEIEKECSRQDGAPRQVFNFAQRIFEIIKKGQSK